MKINLNDSLFHIGSVINRIIYYFGFLNLDVATNYR